MSLTTQVDVICFDVSGSMRGSSFDRDKSRAEAGKILFQAMIDKICGAELRHAIGLMTFGERLDFSRFTRDCTKFEHALGEVETNQGSTKLYDAIDEAATKIEHYRKRHADELDPNCFFRIFCLTDGQDTSSSSRHWEVAAHLCRSNIVLDAFPLAEPNNWFQAMAAATGGLVLTVSDVTHGISLFEREAVLRLDCRDTPSPSRLTPPTCDAYLRRLFSSEAARAVSDVKSSMPKQALAPVLCGVYEVALAAKAASTDITRRVFRELKELQQAQAALAVYVNASDYLFWKVLLEGPAGTPYEGCRWMLSVQFPSSYPTSAPQVKFLTPIYHLNCSSDGRICLDLLTTSWNPNLNITRVILAIRTMLEHPNSSDPLDTYKASVFKDDHARYEREAREHSRQFASESVDALKRRFRIDN